MSLHASMNGTIPYLVILMLTPWAVAQAVEQADPKPNVVVILADDWGWGDLSCYPQDPANPDGAMQTPNLDRLARQGVRFTQAYSQTMCSPARAALLTGRFPQRFGFDELSDARVGIPKSEATLAEVLRDHGYTTACIGKWHVGLEEGNRPLDRGFDRFYGFLGPAHDYLDPTLGVEHHGPLTKGVYVYDQNTPVTKMDYITDQFTDVAIDFIRDSARAKKPFFLYLPYNAPHGPAQPRPDIKEIYERTPAKNPDRNSIRAVEHSIDMNVGRLLHELARIGIDDNTIVVFSSDNGGNEYETRDGEIRTHQHNGGLRGCKFTCWEGGFRVPLIVRWPGQFPANTTYTQTVSLVDLYATVTSAAGIDLPKSRSLDSVNLKPFVLGQDLGTPHEVLHACNNVAGKQWAVRKGNWKLVHDYAYKDPRDKSASLVFGLYDMSQEIPKERDNLIDQHPEVVAELKKLHDEFVVSCLAASRNRIRVPSQESKVANREGGDKVKSSNDEERPSSLRVASLFTDHMVLQRNKPVPVWGFGDAGAEIRVTIAGQSHTTRVDDQGRWRVKLNPLTASSEPRELRVHSLPSDEQILLRDVLVGDVWLAGGQSNMGSRMHEYLESVGDEIPRADYPDFRVFTLPQRKVASEPESDAAWEVVSPNSVPGISATAYFFGRDLHRHLQIPVGIVVCAWGGTFAENWIDRELLQSNTETKPIVDRYEAAVASYRGDANYRASIAAWKQRMEAWQEKRKSKGRAGAKEKEPMGPEHFQRPSGLYETMFKTIPPFAFKGIVFYQGESNVADGRSHQYRHLLPMLVQNWRRDLAEELPFLVVQLPVIKGQHDDEWAEMRESQAVACREMNNCELAVVLEYGEFDKLHPRRKEGVGSRLAMLARGTVYGEEIVCRGPTLQSHRVDGSKIILEFDSIGGGLVAKGELRDFAVCDASGKFVAAKAEIVGSTVVVYHEGIANPVAARYGWKNFFEPSLYNREGFSAGPFRTDSFPLKTEGFR